MKSLFVGALAASAAILASSAQAAVNVAYSDPAGGWKYALTGDAAAAGTSATTDNFDALDGTWDRTSGGDSWAGDGIGGALVAATNPPGGISALSEAGGVNFLRLQDVGDPRDHGFADATGGNLANVGSDRRIALAHSLTADGVTTTYLDTGVTLSFRARLATAATGIVDPQYPDTATAVPVGENNTLPAATAWPVGGSGGAVSDGGKGDFSLRQNTGDKIISFSLGLDTERRADGPTLLGTTGLNMNSLNTATANDTVDPFQGEGTLRILPVANLTTWHEFWITIKASDAGAGELGTHRVAIYKDGATFPDVFFVTAGTGNDYAIDYLNIGPNNTAQQNGYDIDFLAYQEGVLVPTAAAGALAGDIDADHDVDGNDFILWQRFDGSAAGLTPILNNFGQVQMIGAVPEPASALLVGVAALTMLASRSRPAASGRRP